MTALPLPGALGADRPPGVAIELLDPPPAIEPAAVDVPAFVCVCERGPVDTPVRIGSWSQFVQVFGGFVANGLGAYAVKGFFEQGGRVCWVVRAVAPTRTTTASPPQPLDRTVSVLASTAGFVAGAAATVEQGEAVHTYLVTAVDHALAQVVWDRPLHPSLDTTLAMTVSTGAGAAHAVLRDAGAAPSLTVSAASPGSWGSALAVVATAGTRVVTRSRGTSGPSATPVETTAGIVVGDRVRISQDGAPVVTGTVIVQAVDPIERLLTWESALPAALDLTAPFTLETTTTSLTVLEHGAVVEIWPDLSLQPRHPRYAPAVLADSLRIRVELAAVDPEPPAPTRVALRGGRDGTAALTTADLLGDGELADHGVATMVPVEEPALLAVPDLVGSPTPAVVRLPPEPPDPCDPCASGEEVPDLLDAVVIEAGAVIGTEQMIAAQQLLIETCERSTERVALLDPPSTAGAATLHDLRVWAARFASSYAVAVVPWLTVLDPRRARDVRRIPACGHLAGMIARCDTESGPWLAPANRSLAWAHGVDSDLTDLEHAIANGDGMLVIRSLPGRGVVPMGARTLSADTLLTFLTVRRTLIALRRALRQHLAWAVFEPCDRGLALTVSSAIATLMEQVWSAGGLAGATAQDSYVLRADLDRAAVGELHIDLAVAIARPAEFVTLRVSRTDNTLDVAEQPQRVGPGAVT